jgi:DNA-directed RNA polymerase subunit RPC12/RpoP/DNA polymerase elongation subunit (family B)
MKYTEEVIKTILDLHYDGMASRQIAKLLEISKSGVNYVVQRNNELQYDPKDVACKKDGPRVLIFDTETSCPLVFAFGRRKQFINDKAIYKEGGRILCFSYKWLGNDTVYSRWLTPKEIEANDDSRLACILFGLYEEADAVVGYNLQGFDDKVVQTRALACGLGKLPSVKKLDPYLQAKKKLRLPSNSLDNVCAYFGLPQKTATGMELWTKVQAGDTKAMQEMVEYCENDVKVLQNVYLLLQNLGNVNTDFNAALYFKDEEVRCRTCGSNDVEATGRSVTTSASVFEEVRCNNCGSVHRHKTSKTSKEKRKNLLI